MPVKKKQCLINGQEVLSIEDFYNELGRQLHFPPHFGNNLDALWDVLTTDISGPISITWNCSGASRSSMGDTFEKVVTLLKRVGEERKDFLFIIND